MYLGGPFGAFGQEPTDEEPTQALISENGLRKLLIRLGYYGTVGEAFAAWAETNLPHDMRPYGIVVDAEGAHINPPEALDVLITQVRSGGSGPLRTLFWAVLTAGVGAVVYAVVQKKIR